MPRPCAVESHAYCYRRRHSPLLKMPRPCAVESHAHCYRRTLSPLLKMPRPCAVESHARCYRRTLSPLLKMPRPCAVESHARCYKKRGTESHRCSANNSRTILRTFQSEFRLLLEASRLVLLAASVKLHGTRPWHLQKLLAPAIY